MDLSQVPLLVLEKVRNKWEKIQTCDFRQIVCDPCAMCIWARICENCPIEAECEEILDESPGWNERRERFLLHIRAEIERRAEAM
ncbi:hypothetical protein M0R72_20425 [Candidatus Pacearchaeota archaeon]|jgi:hypothetical protein|nr:hypothetical protein [Candidatus Pacearchaeota archaeon]